MHLSTCRCTQCCIDPNDSTIAISKRKRRNIGDQRFKDFLLRSLMLVNPCFDETDSTDRINTLYEILRPQSRCDQELLYLLVRREMLKQVMFCESFRVDSRDVLAESNSVSEFESEGSSTSEAQQTGHSSSFSDLIGSQRYNDFADTTLRAETQRTAYSQSHDESHTRGTDFGSGEAVSDTDGERKSLSDRLAHDESESNGNSNSSGAARGCNYQMSQSQTKGSGFNILIAGFARTGTKQTWDHLMRNDTFSESRATRVGRSLRTLDSIARSAATSLRVSSSYFNALVDELSWGFHQGMAEDHSRAQSDTISHAEGLGQSNTESRAKGQTSTQATSHARSRFDARRRGNRSAFNITDDVAYGQRFKNLRKLYQNTLDFIKYKRSLLIANGYGIGKITSLDVFCREDGFIPYDFADATQRLFCQPISCHHGLGVGVGGPTRSSGIIR